MKKYLSIILSLFMLFALSACSGNSSPTIEENNGASSNGNASSQGISDQFKGKLAEPYMKLIASKNYMVETEIDGNSTVFACSGDNKILVTVNINEVRLTLMKVDNRYYVATQATKEYATVDEDFMNQLNFTRIANATAMSDLSKASFVETGSTTVGEETLTYEDYYNPLSVMTNRYYFDSEGTLKYFGAVESDGTVSTPVRISMYETPTSAFDIVREYKRVTVDGISESIDNASGGTDASAQAGN